MARISLCHANKDKPKVRDVYNRLKDEGFQPWLDEEDLLPSQLWEQEIPRALKASDFILIFFSQHTRDERGYFQRELKLALNAWEEMPEGAIHTIPVRIGRLGRGVGGRGAVKAAKRRPPPLIDVPRETYGT
jgi:hypothetical protein